MSTAGQRKKLCLLDYVLLLSGQALVQDFSQYRSQDFFTVRFHDKSFDAIAICLIFIDDATVTDTEKNRDIGSYLQHLIEFFRPPLLQPSVSPQILLWKNLWDSRVLDHFVPVSSMKVIPSSTSWRDGVVFEKPFFKATG